MAAIVALRAPVVRLGENRLAHRNHRNAHRLAGAFEDLFAATERYRGEIVFPGWQDFEVIVLPANANHLLDSFVIRREFFITNRPIVFYSVHRVLAKVDRSVAQHNRVPVQRPASKDANAVHAHAIGILVTNRVVEIRRIKKLLLFAAQSAEWEFIRPTVGTKLGWLHLLARFEEDDLRTRLAKLSAHHTTGCTRSDDTDVVSWLRFAHIHHSKISPRAYEQYRRAGLQGETASST